MAAVVMPSSRASHAPPSLTPPGSSHGQSPTWAYPSEGLPQHSTVANVYASRRMSAGSRSLLTGAAPASKIPEPLDTSPRSKDSVSRKSVLEGAAMSSTHAERIPAEVGVTIASPTNAESPDGTNSLWIHRDKLVEIENAELQAAGIIIPKTRTQPKSRISSASSESLTKRRKTPQSREIASPDVVAPVWDSRTPEEAAGADSTVSQTVKAGSRIPIPKTSLHPIRDQHVARDSPVQNKRDASPEGPTLDYAKRRNRSSSAATVLKNDSSPPKPTMPTKRGIAEGSPRNASMPRKVSAKTPTTRTKPRAGTPKDHQRGRNTEVNTRPMEGDPPWLVGSYKPDPRLPPDQQLLPTVAKRLQQEKWEKEGKFGNVYDKEFRPLTDHGFADPPDKVPGDPASDDPDDPPSPATPPPQLTVREEPESKEWPLKSLDSAPKPSPSPARSTGYSTMPKIHNAPPSPLQSPRRTFEHAPARPVSQAVPPKPVVRLPEEPPESKKGSGCACCVIM